MSETTIESILKPLVQSTSAMPGWELSIQDRDGQVELQIYVQFADSYHPERVRFVIHCFLVPNASYDYRAWRWWLFRHCMLVQQHELAEFFRQTTDIWRDESFIEFKPFRPNHAAGRDPYQVLEVGTEVDAQAAPGSVAMS